MSEKFEDAKHPLAGKTCSVTDGPHVGEVFRVEDYSWHVLGPYAHPTLHAAAFRVRQSGGEPLYGKIEGYGHIVDERHLKEVTK